MSETYRNALRTCAALVIAIGLIGGALGTASAGVPSGQDGADGSGQDGADGVGQDGIGVSRGEDGTGVSRGQDGADMGESGLSGSTSEDTSGLSEIADLGLSFDAISQLIDDVIELVESLLNHGGI